MIRYQIKIHKEKNQFWGEFPDLPGCVSVGKSLSELLESAKEALSLYLEEARDPRWNVPEPKKRSGEQYIWVSPFEDVAIPLMIRKARLKKKLGQRQLAKLMGVSVQQIQKLETPGASNPTIRTLVSLARALGEELEIKLIAS